MKNHLVKCDAYLSSVGNEPVFHLQMDGPLASDTPIQGMGHHHGVVAPPPGPLPDGSTPAGPSTSQQDPNASALGMPGAGTAPANNGGEVMATPLPPATMSKVAQNGLDKVRQAMGRSTRRLESLEAVLKTQVQDGMQNAATHVRAAIRDERDRLFKLSQTLVKQEVRFREQAQNAIVTF